MRSTLQASALRCDVTAVVLDTQPVRCVKTRSGERIDCYVVFLGDPSLQYVQLSMWRQHAFDAVSRIAIGDVVAVSSLRKSEFQGAISLNSTAQTGIKLLCRSGAASEHCYDEAAHSLLQWAKLTFPAITRQLKTYTTWQCSTFKDIFHAAFVSVAATMVSSEVLVDDEGNQAVLLVSDPVRHRSIMYNVISRIGVRFQWRNLVCAAHGSEWRLLTTPHTTVEVVSNENMVQSGYTRGRERLKDDDILTAQDGDDEIAMDEDVAGKDLLSVRDACELLSQGADYFEVFRVRGHNVSFFVDGCTSSAFDSDTTEEIENLVRHLCERNDAGRWVYKAGNMVVHDDTSGSGVGLQLQVSSEVMERILCCIPAAVAMDELAVQPHQRSGWVAAVVQTFRSLQGVQRPPLDFRLRRMRCVDNTTVTLLEAIEVAAEFILEG